MATHSSSSNEQQQQQLYQQQGPEHVTRLQDPAKWSPVFFVWFLIWSLYVIYTGYHLVPNVHDSNRRNSAIFDLVVFNVIFVMLLICYVLSIIVGPGSIPTKEEDPSGTWEYATQDKRGRNSDGGPQSFETKRTGDRRHCKWCWKYKPDRCHHCRVCRQCILRMDHHCPWIYNCVGFRNHKYFFLLLVYSTIECQLIMWNMFDTVREALDKDDNLFKTFVLLFGETLAVFLGILVTLFLLFHTWLMMKAMTTIEFCEKQTKKVGSYHAAVYDRGFYGNVCGVLGDNPFLWLLPLSPPSGDGLSFVDERAPLKGDVESAPVRPTRSRNKPGASPSESPRSASSMAADSALAFQDGAAVRATAGTGSAPGSQARLYGQPIRSAKV